MKRAQTLLIAWSVLLIGALTWPLVFPGQLATRDMMVLDSPRLTHAALGFGDLAARNVPQDGFLALVGAVLPASWVVRVLIVAAAALAAAGAVWLSRLVRQRAGLPASAWASAASITVAVINPFVVERLLQGQWSLVIAAWLLPLVAAAGLAARPGIQGLALLGATLTPTGGFLATLTAVFTARGRQRWAVGALGVAAMLVWIVPGLMAASTASAASVAAFAPRAEGHVGTLGALLGLGGIWNAEAVPASREAGWAIAGVILALLLALNLRRCPPALVVLAGLGLGGAIAAWLFPGALGWAVEHLPGAGLFRDAHKLTMLAIPAYTALAGLGRAPYAAAVLALSILQVIDAPREVAVLRPAAVATVGLDDARDTFFPNHSTLTTRPDGVVVVHPAPKELNVVESGALTVDGVEVDPPSPRWVAAQKAWSAKDLDELAELGIGLVVDGDTVSETGAGPRPLPAVGIALLAWWCALPLLWVLMRWWARRRR